MSPSPFTLTGEALEVLRRVMRSLTLLMALLNGDRALGFFTYLWIDDEAAPFRAKFHRLGMKENRRHSREMAAALTGDQAFLAT